MTGFSADWLALRERYDRHARNPEIIDILDGTFRNCPSIAVVDLACGTGATLRAISSRLPPRQHWRLVDNDLGLLARAAALAHPPDITVLPRTIDLARDLELALDGPTDLIATSALLDLVSQTWIDRLAVEAAARRLPVYAALSYDGRTELAPAERFDGAVIAAVNAHQRTDKGFGRALGPEAATAAVRAFRRIGYAVQEGRSDWILQPVDREIQLRLLAGLAMAASEMGSLERQAIASWLEQRQAHVVAGCSTTRVGHVDFLARPIGTL
jgi:SAM-dependent methyltransferase